MIKMIVAIGKNNLIGKDGKMAWYVPEELQFFKKQTLNHYVLFGRTTFEGINNYLKDRKIVLLTSKETSLPVDVVIHNEEELINIFKKFQNSEEILWIAGGKSIYEKYYMYAEEIWVSKIDTSAEGNVFLNIDFDKLEGYKLKEVQAYDKFDVHIYTKDA